MLAFCFLLVMSTLSRNSAGVKEGVEIANAVAHQTADFDVRQGIALGAAPNRHGGNGSANVVSGILRVDGAGRFVCDDVRECAL